VLSLSDDDANYPVSTQSEESAEGESEMDDTDSEAMQERAPRRGARLEDLESTDEDSPVDSPLIDNGDYLVSCDECCYAPRNWVSADYLMWWTKGNALPPLVSGGPTAVLPASQVLFGNEQIDTDLRNGARLTFGHGRLASHLVLGVR
jgi:hypothetical protein